MTPKPRLRSQQARSELTVQHILEATFLLIKSEKKLNMQSIADRAGVSIGTVYHHFESKSDLMTAAFSAYLDDVYEQIFRACTKPAGMRKPLLKTMFREAFTYLQTSVCVRSFLARPPARDHILDAHGLVTADPAADVQNLGQPAANSPNGRSHQLLAVADLFQDIAQIRVRQRGPQR